MSEASIERYLAGHPFFEGLAAESVGFLAACAKERELPADRILIRHGDPARSFYLVRAGRISREVPSLVGAPLCMHSVGDGELLGWSWFVPPYEWSFLARAEVPTRVLEFDACAVLARCDEEPGFGYAVLIRFSQLMSERLMRARRKMLDDWLPPGFTSL